MTEELEQTAELLVEDEMKQAYLTFAMSVIVSRALPDVRDGLKPCQRRILVGMNELNLGPRSKTRKCGKVVGDVHGNYHPHGDTAIYDTLVRMAQPFTLRYPLIEGQGNFGSMDGDPAAAMRYTEARLSEVGAQMLADLALDTVEFVENYDNTRQEPVVLPARFPNLLANGASGIAVGMATSIPPHNIGELCDAIIRVVDEPEVTIAELIEIMPGPDFPTGGIICGTQGIREGYTTGRGIITLRGRTHCEEGKGGHSRIVVTEVPYRVNRDSLVEKIATAVQAGTVCDVSDVRNESDREGTRIVIELKRGADENVVLNQLYRHTPLQSSVSIIMIAIVNGRPQTLSIKQILQAYVDHRIEVIERRTRHLLAKATQRAHILAGLRVAVINIDEVVQIIRSSKEASEAQQTLMDRFELSDKQAEAILAMRLRSLVGLERIKVEREYEELQGKIEDYNKILGDRNLVLDIIREDLYEIKDKFGDARRTAIAPAARDLAREDLIPKEDVVVTLSHGGYIKRTSQALFRSQGRGGKGVIGAELAEGDFIGHMFASSTHDYIMFFTNLGLVYWPRVFEIPQGVRTGRGRALVNFLSLRDGEGITGVIPVREFEEDFSLLMATERGTVKKTSLGAFGKRGSGGIVAIALGRGDRLVGVRKTTGNSQAILVTRNGRAIRFSETQVRQMGRTAGGVRGIRLRRGDRVVDMAVLAEPEQEARTALVTVCENGYGKRTALRCYPLRGRGGVGVMDIKTTRRNGKVVAASEVAEDQHLMVITQQGMMVKIPVASIREISRNTQGVKLIAIAEGDRVSAVVPIASEGPRAD